MEKFKDKIKNSMSTFIGELELNGRIVSNLNDRSEENNQTEAMRPQRWKIQNIS